MQKSGYYSGLQSSRGVDLPQSVLRLRGCVSGVLMLAYDDFGDDVEAHLSYSYTRPPQEAAEIVRRRLEDDSWRRAPALWLNRFQALAFQKKIATEEADRIRRLFFEKLVSGPISPEVHETLVEFFRASEQPPSPQEAEQLVQWLLNRSGPGEASLVADILHHVFNRTESRSLDDGLARIVYPLAEWLIENGAAELRSKRRALLTLDLVEAVHARSESLPLLAATVRYFLVNEHGPGSRGYRPFRIARLLAAVEHLVAAGDTSSLARDVVQASGRVESIVDPPDEETYPRLRAAALRSLVGGGFTDDVTTLAWRSAFWAPFPDGDNLAFRRSQDLDVALELLHEHAAHGRRPTRDAFDEQSEHAQTWARFLTVEFLRVYEAAGQRPPNRAEVEKLRRCVGFGTNQPVTNGIFEGLREVLLQAPDLDRLRLAKRITAQATDPIATESILLALATDGANPVVRGVEPGFLTALQDRLAAVVGQPWSSPIEGVRVADFLKGARRVEFADLDNEDKIRVEGDVVYLDAPAVAEATNLRWPLDDRLALGTMYFLHELVHVVQGIGEKKAVGDLRSAGAEGTVMHMDLAADHIAALLTNRAVPRWDVNWLKGLQGRCLVNFTVGPYHTAASRSRKAHRLVGLRLDYFTRVAGVLDEHGGYVFADYGPAGGKLLVLNSGPPVSLLGGTRLEASEAVTLDRAADEDANLQEVDRVLKATVDAIIG